MRKIWLLLLFTVFIHISEAQVPVYRDVFTKVDPPSLYNDRVSLNKTATAIFQRSYIEQVDSLTFFPVEVKNAVDKALDIWGCLINANHTINVKIVWRNIDDANILA